MPSSSPPSEKPRTEHQLPMDSVSMSPTVIPTGDLRGRTVDVRSEKAQAGSQRRLPRADQIHLTASAAQTSTREGHGRGETSQLMSSASINTAREVIEDVGHSVSAGGSSARKRSAEGGDEGPNKMQRTREPFQHGTPAVLSISSDAAQSRISTVARPSSRPVAAGQDTAVSLKSSSATRVTHVHTLLRSTSALASAVPDQARLQSSIEALISEVREHTRHRGNETNSGILPRSQMESGSTLSRSAPAVSSRVLEPTRTSASTIARLSSDQRDPQEKVSGAFTTPPREHSRSMPNGTNTSYSDHRRDHRSRPAQLESDKLELQRAAKAGSAEQMTQILNTIERHRFKLDVKMCVLAIKTYVRAGDLPKAAEFLERMEIDRNYPEPNEKAYHLLMNGYLNQRDSQHLLHLLDKMEQRGICPTPRIYYFLMDDFLSKYHSSQALSLLKKMEEKNVGIDLSVYVRLIDVLFADEKWEEADNVIVRMEQKGIRPDKETYDRIMNGLLIKHDTERAHALLGRQETHGIPPNTDTYNRMIGKFLFLRNFDKAYMLLKRMQQNQVPRDIVTYNKLMACCICQNNPDTGIRFFEKMKKEGIQPDRTAWSNYIDLCLKKEAHTVAFEALDNIDLSDNLMLYRDRDDVINCYHLSHGAACMLIRRYMENYFVQRGRQSFEISTRTGYRESNLLFSMKNALSEYIRCNYPYLSVRGENSCGVLFVSDDRVRRKSSM